VRNGRLSGGIVQPSRQAKTVKDRRILQEESIFGAEAKSLPYLLAQMNLLLHGVETPQIDPQNSLSKRLTDIGDSERVDIIVTNPPFGGEEEKGIQGNFPEDKRTSETALLFLQLIMRKLRRHPNGSSRHSAKCTVYCARIVCASASMAGTVPIHS